jgi:hypothetical protein
MTMPYRRGLMIPTQWAGAVASTQRQGSLPFVTIPCPACGQQAVLKYREGFRCGYGHETRASDVEFVCLKEGCRRTARLTPTTTLSCGRHDVDPGPVFKCY